jgi:hypothetical protein
MPLSKNEIENLKKKKVKFDFESTLKESDFEDSEQKQFLESAFELSSEGSSDVDAAFESLDFYGEALEKEYTAIKDQLKID